MDLSDRIFKSQSIGISPQKRMSNKNIELKQIIIAP
jgi:hypothetical protein